MMVKLWGQDPSGITPATRAGLSCKCRQALAPTLVLYSSYLLSCINAGVKYYVVI